MKRATALVLALGVHLIAGPVESFVGPVRPSPEERAPERARAQRVPADASAFRAMHGGTWVLDRDPRTGRVVAASGSGLPLVPDDVRDVTLESLEPPVRAFIDDHAGMLAPSAGTLVLDRNTSSIRRDGRLASLSFAWYVDGVRVEGARVFVRINHGNITQFGAPLIGRAPQPVEALLTAADALQAALAHGGDEELGRLHDEPELVYQTEAIDAGLGHRLIWLLEYVSPGRPQTWEVRIDARSGEVVGYRDVTAYGRVQGGVYPRTVTDSETIAPFPYSTLDGDLPVQTDVSGAFPYSGGRLDSGLEGQFFSTVCRDGCSNPEQAALGLDVGVGLIDFGFGGDDEVGNGRSTLAERMAFFKANQVRRIAKQWLPGEGWFSSRVILNVNRAGVCDANWNGEANFFRSGGGCSNTGEIADVIEHEWGHGLDGNTNAGDSATSEGTADVVAMHMNHDHLIGPDFLDTGEPVRDLNSATTAKGVLTRSNIGSKCDPGNGPLGFEVHCEGEIYGQVSWDLAQALAARHGHHTGWRESERLFFTSLPDAGSYLPEEPESVYDAYLQADDDDGNLSNGTPHGQEIFDAFDAHGIAGTNFGASPACARPAQPAVTVTPRCGAFDLSWTSVAGIDHFTVLRGEITADAPFFVVAEPSPSTTAFTDQTVMPGVDYHYVVAAVAADGCESTVEGPVAARLDPAPLLTAIAADETDEPRGNRSGFADPGEEVDVVVRLANRGELASTAITGTLTSPTPGVTILEGSDGWPALVPGAEADNQAVLRFETDESQLACGERLDFELALSEGSACPAEISHFDVVLGDRQLIFEDDFETDQGWQLDSVNSTASAGDWTRGDPEPTSFQPGDDVTAGAGTDCWFTAPNPSSASRDDVDNGVTILLSPVIDLSGSSTATLSYWRWFGNRDVGEDPNDYFLVEVSNDAGGSWVELELLDSNVNATEWTRREYALHELLPLTAQMQLRFHASDGGPPGNIVEAAIDEVRIENLVCDDTPACFVEPTFAGLDSALPGSSCGETRLAWTAAASNCQNATIGYSVYRSTDPAFVPGPSTRIAEGLSGTSFVDTLLQPGVDYTYIVRAEDSRSGEDSNLARRTVAPATGPDAEPPVFAGLQTAAAGSRCGEVALSWTQAQESCNVPVSYRVYRSTDPGFAPDASTLIGSSLSLGFVDAALAPGVDHTYLVRAIDEAGNEEANDVRLTARSGSVDLVLVNEEFEPGDGGWSVVSPNDANTGNWEHGDPEGTAYQPEDDRTVAGVNAWITGLAAAGGAGGNDIDGGRTTLRSARYDLSGTVDPAVRYSRWFTNDMGNNPGEDPFTVEISNDDGAQWTQLEQISAGTPLAWVDVELGLPGGMQPTSQMRVRFLARDRGGGSLVEAGIDDFQLVDRDQGCSGCPAPDGAVGTIVVDRSGPDIVLDWSTDPVSGARYIVYTLGGPGFTDAIRIGSTETKSFVHEGAALSGEDFYYRVTFVDDCGNESELE